MSYPMDMECPTLSEKPDLKAAAKRGKGRPTKGAAQALRTLASLPAAPLPLPEAPLTLAPLPRTANGPAWVGTLTQDAWQRILTAAADGIAVDKLWALSGMGKSGWARCLQDEPWRSDAIEEAAIAGEAGMVARIRRDGPDEAAGDAWVLERSRPAWGKRAQGSPLPSAPSILALFSPSEPKPLDVTPVPKIGHS